jgi:hypothetical protein
MNRKAVIALLVCSMLLALPGADHIIAQNKTQPPDTVEILVVDDFSGESFFRITENFYDPDAMAMILAEAGYPDGEIEDIQGINDIVNRLAGTVNEETFGEYVGGIYETANCVVNLEEQGHARAGMIGGSVSNHGGLVVALLEELETDFGIDVLIEQIPTTGLRTDVVANRIQEATKKYDYHVINMSFVIVPCALVDDFARYQLMMAYADDNGEIATLEATLAALTGFAATIPSIDNDPLLNLLNDYDQSVIPVASAGNFGFDFPYYPGAWETVVSVSGSEDEYGFVAYSDLYVDEYGSSNSGEVKMPGVWTRGSTRASGTSFAAPRLSYLMAVYLQEAGGDVCRTNAPTFADTDWYDLDLIDAAHDFPCEDLLDIAGNNGLLVP